MQGDYNFLILKMEASLSLSLSVIVCSHSKLADVMFQVITHTHSCMHTRTLIHTHTTVSLLF